MVRDRGKVKVRVWFEGGVRLGLELSTKIDCM